MLGAEGSDIRMRLADFVAAFLLKNGIDTCFTVTGGGAMHLNDALGHAAGLHCVYHHHEQACAMAAEAYARVENRVAAVCVTSGPGGVNALTGVLGAYLDSIPMLVLSGQVRTDTTVRHTGLSLRALGDQEFDITRAVAGMTKYAVMLNDPTRTRYELEKALYLAREGRPGPCWIDIPIDLQGAMIDPDTLPGFDGEMPPVAADPDVIREIVARLRAAERPVLYAGNGIRISGMHTAFCRLAERLGIPVVTAWNGVDLLPTDHPLYVGRGGMLGDRAGNLAVECADVILALGTRLSIRQVGYRYGEWAKDAFVIYADVDAEELKKPTVHAELPVHADLRTLLPALLLETENWNTPCDGWRKRCICVRERYPVVQGAQQNAPGPVNPYHFLHMLSARLPQGAITVVGNGSACVMGSQAWTVREGQRYVANSGAASMGYDLPAAIGAAIGAGCAEVICVTGDGSIQMNLQELQTILTNRIPVRIFVINNGGYHSIRQSQQNAFPQSALVGIGTQSGDLEFPVMQRLARAYGYVYLSCDDNQKLPSFINAALGAPAPLIAEVFVDINQRFEPKSATQKLPDGTLCSPPLYDLAPFLDRDELAQVMGFLKQ